MEHSTDAVERRRHHLRVGAAALVASGITVLALLLHLSSIASGSPNDPNAGHTVTICHATASSTNPFTNPTVDVAAGGLKGGHHDHEGDIIPPFTYVDKDGQVNQFPGHNMGTSYDGVSGAELLSNGCEPIDVPPPTDVCPNIDGNQSVVPPGMELDDGGNCVSPPPAVDACPNIDGIQDLVPEGLIIDADGNCVPPRNENDACPNIDGDQDSIPDGMVLDAQGACVKPNEPGGPTDACPNIPGDQASVPAGHVLDGGACVVPTTPSTPSTPNAEAPTTPNTAEPATPTPPTTPSTPGESAAPADDASPTTVPQSATPTGDRVETTKTLPYTGTEETVLIAVGFGLVVGGILLEVAYRRRPRPKD